ncbi:MAG: hypothetical protein K5896_03150 [Prevotella sp.]|nr:hypothetical protein [Prevotella sp.]
MKKNAYLAPAIKDAETMTPELLNGASITEVTGDTGVGMGEGEAPTEADSRIKKVWGSEEKEEEY